MTQVDEIEALARQLETGIPGVRVEYKNFPSGAGWLDVYQGDHWYQLVYTPSWKLFSVDECTEDDAFQMSFRYNYPDFEPAARRLLEFLKVEQPLASSFRNGSLDGPAT